MDLEKDFAVFILSHNRAKNIDTLKTLTNGGYKGKWYVVISTDNTQIKEYEKIIPRENLLVFDKKKVVVDTMLSSKRFEPRSAVYARNFILDYAKERYKYFLMADDDIKDIVIKHDANGHIKNKKGACHINKIIEYFCGYLEESNIAGIALAIGSGYFGGVTSMYRIEREICCFMVLKSSMLRRYRGIQCEDVILSCDNFDQVYLTYRGACVIMPIRGTNKGGNEYDTQSLPPNLFWLISAPSAVQCVGRWGRRRFNKKIYPCIISEKYKKQ